MGKIGRLLFFVQDFAIDDRGLYKGIVVEWMPIQDDDIRIFPRLQAAHTIVNAKQLRGRNRNGFQYQGHSQG